LAQLTNLALLCRALYARHCLVFTDLARAYPVPKRRNTPKPKRGRLHRAKRLWRLLANQRLNPADLMLRLTHLSCSLCRTPGLLLPVLVDLTYFEPYVVLSANVPRGGRDLSIAWRAYRRDLRGEGKRCQNQIIGHLLAQMLGRSSPPSMQ
jgi:hypothetical protein